DSRWRASLISSIYYGASIFDKPDDMISSYERVLSFERHLFGPIIDELAYFTSCEINGKQDPVRLQKYCECFDRNDPQYAKLVEMPWHDSAMIIDKACKIARETLDPKAVSDYLKERV
ncbi:MAG: hypothetical protein ABIJ08_02135, partial [Nanoarchaeota archaeon]